MCGYDFREGQGRHRRRAPLSIRLRREIMSPLAPAGGAVLEIRVGHQPDDREDAWSYRARQAARRRRRGD